MIAEIERRLRVSEPVIKFITVRMDLSRSADEDEAAPLNTFAEGTLDRSCGAGSCRPRWKRRREPTPAVSSGLKHNHGAALRHGVLAPPHEGIARATDGPRKTETGD